MSSWYNGSALGFYPNVMQVRVLSRMPNMKVKITKKTRSVKIKKGDLGDLFIYLAGIILPSLKAFRKIKTDIPSSVYNEFIVDHTEYDDVELERAEAKALKAWHACIDKMIWSFAEILKDDAGIYGTEKERQKHADKIQEGLNLFAQHFQNLWI